jgi:hypothetical protein
MGEEDSEVRVQGSVSYELEGRCPQRPMCWSSDAEKGRRVDAAKGKQENGMVDMRLCAYVVALLQYSMEYEM